MELARESALEAPAHLNITLAGDINCKLSLPVTSIYPTVYSTEWRSLQPSRESALEVPAHWNITSGPSTTHFNPKVSDRVQVWTDWNLRRTETGARSPLHRRP